MQHTIHKLFGFVLVIGLILIALMHMTLITKAATSVFYPFQGGTGASTTPSYGQVLVGTASGVYAVTSTTTTALSPWTTSGNNIYNNNNNNTGNVGIGTSSPTLATLSVQGIGATSATINFLTANSANTTLWGINNAGALFIGTSTTAAGSTGITVAGGSTYTQYCRTDSTFFCAYTDNNNGSFNNIVTNSAGFGWKTDATYTGTGSYTGGIFGLTGFRSASQTIPGNWLFGSSTSNVGAAHVTIWGKGAAANAYFNITSVAASPTNGDLFVVNTNGLVGVGSTTPWGQLSASSTSATVPTLAVQQNSTGPAISVIGNVGIGTTSPSAAITLGRNGQASSTIAVAEYNYGSATSTSEKINCLSATQQHIGIGVSATTLLLDPTSMIPGQTCRIIVENPNATSGAITWSVAAGAILLWSGGTVPTQTTTANKQDIWSFVMTHGSSTNAILGAMSPNF